MKIVTWNINQAAYTRKNLWDWFDKIDFDVGLFQEVYIIPYTIRKRYYVVRGEMNAILIKKTLNAKPEKEIIIPNNSEIDLLADFYVSAKIKSDKKKVVFVSVYNYMGPGIKEFSKFLDILFNYIKNNMNQIIIIGGDFNMDERFENNLKEWGKLAKMMKDELYKLGYNEILSHKFGQDAYTFITPNKKRRYQLDYLFIPRHIKIKEIKLADENQIFNKKPRLSDHLPIISILEL